MAKFILIIGTLFFILSLAAIENHAATKTVFNLNNSGANSLRQAIFDSNSGDTIVFQAGLRGTVHLNSQLLIDKNLTISGPGANVIWISGELSVRVFNISAGNVQISGLRIANGFVSGAGGGVLVDGGNLTLNNCQLTNNDAESGGGALVFGGSTLTITNSTINGNSSAVEGGGVSNRGGTLFLINTTINGNTAPRGGGVSVENGAATILNSTISENNTGDSSTSNVGGLRVISFGSQLANVILKNTIVANNSPSFAPIGETADPEDANSTGNTIFSGVSRSDVSGTVNSQGNNLIGDPTGGTGFIASDLLNINPLLAPLAANGGTTPTQALSPGSPAIDAGNNSGAPATDQRGAARPQNTTVDIGAFESGAPVTSGGTPTGSNVNVPLGAVSVTFNGVTLAGTTTQIPILPSAAGTLPNGYTFGTGFPAYEITTTAVYTAPVTVCLQVPGVTDLTIFNSLTLFHGEGGMLIDRTVSRDFATLTICSSVSSLSPFVIAQNLAPTNAGVSVSGRVLTTNGSGISRAQVSIINQNGETRTAITNSFGFYRFDEIAAGEVYVLDVRHKVYQFNSRAITVLDHVQNADFTAESQ